MGRRLAERIPGAKFIFRPACAHERPIRRPEATVAAYLGFLDSLAGRATP